MEYLDGGNLHDFLSERNTSDIPWFIRCRLAAEISSGLAYLHFSDKEKTFCHGDLKPENILLTHGLHAKLADFGSTKLSIATGASTASSVCKNTQITYQYVAPEVLEDSTQKAKPSMDMYR